MRVNAAVAAGWGLIDSNMLICIGGCTSIADCSVGVVAEVYLLRSFIIFVSQ